MSAVGFIVYFIVLIVVFFSEDYIVDHLNRWLKDANINFFIKEKWLTYFLILIMAVIMVLGIFIDDTGYQDSVSSSLKNIKPKETDGLFGFNFDVFNF